jgi:peptidoglycan biosynthesis protein MviN/MurJ (putative lipid II flippase)
MKGRFPPDLFAVVFGPVIVVVIALGLGSFIFHAEQIRGSVAAYGIIAGAVVALLIVLFCRRRRRP